MNNNTPLVSVCMITYNHEKFIAEAIDGVMMQKTDFQIEQVIGEDCSTDNTRKICLEYKEKYPDKIKLLLPEANLGVNQNFFETIKNCKGKYIALCEGDDYWTDPQKLQRQVDFLEANEDFSICFHNVKIWKEKEQKLVDDFVTREVSETTDIYELAKGNFIHTPSVVFRKNESVMETLQKMNNLPVGDYLLHLLNAQYGKIRKLNDVMAIYRIHKGGIWSTKEATYTLPICIDLIEQLKMLFKDFRIIQNLNIQESECAIWLCMNYWKQNNENLAEYYYNIALKYSPNNLFKSINDEMVTLQNNYKQIKNSKTYRLGEFLLKPFSYFRNKLK